MQTVHDSSDIQHKQRLCVRSIVISLDFEVLAPFDILWANFEVDAGKKTNFNQLMMRRTKRVCYFFLLSMLENQPSHFYNLIFIGDFNGERNSENRFVQV